MRINNSIPRKKRREYKIDQGKAWKWRDSLTGIKQSTKRLQQQLYKNPRQIFRIIHSSNSKCCLLNLVELFSWKSTSRNINGVFFTNKKRKEKAKYRKLNRKGLQRLKVQQTTLPNQTSLLYCGLQAFSQCWLLSVTDKGEVQYFMFSTKYLKRGCEKYKYEKKTRNIVYIIKPGIVE